jgi:uncharacterized Ntn-hydrolase superfamily protein
VTFSLLGRCARTGMLGAVVTTSAIAVGSRCPAVRAGVGAALSQSRTDPRLGPIMIDLMARGLDARRALEATVAGTPHAAWRQLAALDAGGGSASFSGARVNPEIGEAQGRDCVAIANIVRNAAIPPAMVLAFEADPARALPDRLLSAILAGEEAGGEFVPLASAALLVAHEQDFPYVDLRVDDHPAPLNELARLWHAYAPLAGDYVLRALQPGAIAAYQPPPES